MLDRRRCVRNKVMYGGVATIGENGATRDCVVRNISENGAGIEFSNFLYLPKEQISLAIAKKGRSFLARVIWSRDNVVGVAFIAQAPSRPADSDLAEKLRDSEKKQRQLQHRIRMLTSES